MSWTVDANDFRILARDLDVGARELVEELAPTVKKSALDIKTSMVADMSASRHFGQVASAIDFDIEDFKAHVRAEIGPASAGKQVGDLAHIAYFGGSKRRGGATVQDPEYLLDREAPVLEEYIEKIIDGIL